MPTRSPWDRSVHAEGEYIEVVRYARAGKWFIESRRPMVPRQRITLDEAVKVALGLPIVRLGKSGGGAFDARYRKQKGGSQ